MNKYLMFTFGKEVYVFESASGCDYKDLIEQVPNIREAIMAVLARIEQMPEGVKITPESFVDSIIGTVRENFSDSKGNPLVLNCVGVGVNILNIEKAK